MAAGEATNTYFLARNLAAYGVDVHVLTSRTKYTHEIPGITIHPVMRDWSWAEVFRLRRLLRKLTPNAILLVYIGFIYNHHPMITFAPTLSKRWIPSAIFVTRIENPFNPPVKLSMLDRVIRKVVAQLLSPREVDYSYGTLLLQSDRIIVLSQRHHAALAEMSPDIARKLRLIPPPPNIRIARADTNNHRQGIRNSLGLNPDAILLVYIGYMYPIRGIDILLHAFQIVTRNHSNIHLLLIGGDIDPAACLGYSYLVQMQNLATTLGVQSMITWTGSFTHVDEWPSQYLQAADLCILPNTNGLQLNNSSFASAVVHALPIVSTKGSNTDPQLQHGENVYLCQPGNPNSLADAIQCLISDPSLRLRISTGARTLAERCFSWDKAIAETIDTLAASSRPQSSCGPSGTQEP